MALPSGAVAVECACREQVVNALMNGVTKPFEAEPHADGIYALREGVAAPIAVRLTTVQQFGRQGTLHRLHKCRIAKRRAHKW